MSLMYARLSNDNILVAADTRIAATLSDGRTIVKQTECDKLIVLKNVDGNNIIFFQTGRLEVVDRVLNEVLTPINNQLNLSNKRITTICRKWHSIYVEGCLKNGLEPEKNDEGIVTSCGLCMLRYDKEVDKMVITYFMPHSDFNAQRVESRLNMVGSLYAGVWDEFKPNAKEWIDENEMKYTDKVDLIRNLYKHCNNVHVGGHLQVYQITKDEINNILFEEIPDKEEFLKESNNHTVLRDDVIIRWKEPMEQDINNALDEALDASSAASSASNKATTANNNVAKLANGQYTSGTFISGTEIASPTISGGIIVGGSYYDSEKRSKLNLSNNGDYSDLIHTRVKDGQELFKIQDNGTFDKAASIFLYGHSIGYGTSGGFYPGGTWNFSHATVKNLNVTFG